MAISPPRASATVVLMRQAAGGAPEVLLVRRHSRNAVAAGAFVFPGGLLDPQDCSSDALACSDIAPGEAARILGTVESPERALGHFLAAIRETFEEVGILIARESSGRLWRALPEDRETLNTARADMRAGRASFWPWLAGRGLRAAARELAYFAHWITPEAMARRFDTRFFLVRAEPAWKGEADGNEVVECCWIGPRAALDAHRSRAMPMVNATVKNLELIASCADFGAARERLCGRAITAILPKAVPQGDGLRIVNPWEPDYEAL